MCHMPVLIVLPNSYPNDCQFTITAVVNEKFGLLHMFPNLLFFNNWVVALIFNSLVTNKVEYFPAHVLAT